MFNPQRINCLTNLKTFGILVRMVVAKDRRTRPDVVQK